MSYSLTTTALPPVSALSAFGTPEVAELTPSLALDFVHGINTQTGVATTANSATTDTNAGRLRLQSGTNSAGSAIFSSRRPLRYRAGQGMTARFTTVFTTGVSSSTQIVGIGSATDGYFVGYNGTSFGILHRNASSDTWTAQASWNGTPVTFDATKGNVWMIKYPYLGYGSIHFFLLSPAGSWVKVHTIQYPNSSATVQLSNPSLFFYAQSLNAGATTNQIVYCGSVGVFISGPRSFVSNPKWATDNSKTGITAETVIFSIRNATTYNGATNRGLIRLNHFSCFGQGGNNSADVFRLRIGATLGGSPSYAAVNGTTADSGVTITAGNSIASVDTAGTTASAGTLIYNISCGNGTTSALDLTTLDLFIAPGETLTVSGVASVSSTLGASLGWTEDI